MSAPRDFDDVLATTRSVRKRIDFVRPIEPDVLLECIDLAVQAPTGANRENWRFLVVTDPEKKLALAALYRRAFDDYIAAAGGGEPASPNYRFLADHLGTFPALLLVCTEDRPPEAPAAQLAYYGSVLPAAWSLMLALRSRGIGATWTTLLASYESEAAAVLGMPPTATPTVLLPAGYMKNAVMKRAARRPAADVTSWNGWA